MAAKRKLPDEPEVYVFKTETSADVKETITKSFNFEIPDFMQISGNEEIKDFNFKVGEEDFNISFYQLSNRKGGINENVSVFSHNHNLKKGKMKVTVTMKVAGVEKSCVTKYYTNEFEALGRFALSLEECQKLSEENGGVLKVSVQITLHAQEPECRTLWKR